MFPADNRVMFRKVAPRFGASAAAGLLRVTLLFGSAALALAFFVAPFASDHRGDATGSIVGGVTTASIGYDGAHLLRRDVWQRSASSICVIRENGTRAGRC